MTGLLFTPANDNTRTPTAYRTSFSGNNEWYTPARYVDLAREVMGAIDLDPASNDYAQRTVKAATYYTAETNGLDKEWHGRVWMNPPYAQPLIVSFIEKLIAEHTAGRVTEAIVLTNNSTDTKWFTTLCAGATAFCFTTGRVKFQKPDGSGNTPPAMGQAFTYMGRRPDVFAAVFSTVGNIFAPLPAVRAQGNLLAA